ncbi:histidine phosphatase family protein [Halococcus agarilyticus]|uniref:histidine phosphatase family protein n=1 Tax=Halococcus agarilyticus TaxID=1232219 RepID=UPI000677BE5E|nr:histidine phosphatase family protein [Halococcus agarilyticus]
MTVLLVRHGETAWNAARRVQGWAPVPLSERGREQATRLGEHLAATYDVDRFVASDLRRTRETAVLVHEAGVDAEPTFDRAWRERDFGVYQGLSYEALFETYPEFAVTESGRRALEAVPERGESLLDCRERVLDGFDRLVADAPGDETVLIVTHGGPLYALLGHLKGIDYVTSIAGESQGNCAVNELRGDQEKGFEIVRENDTSYRE